MPDLEERLCQSLSADYDVQRELGTGGMAIVHFVHDHNYIRKVAIKVLR